MAGKPGRSGPPGNLHAAKHGRQAWLKRRALPVHLAHVRELVQAEEEALLSDKGGDSNVTAAERALIQDCGTAYGLIMLALEEARTRGCITVDPQGVWDLQPGLQRLKGLIDSRRMNLLALGLQRRAKPIDEQDIVSQARALAEAQEAEFARARAEEENADA